MTTFSNPVRLYRTLETRNPKPLKVLKKDMETAQHGAECLPGACIEDRCHQVDLGKVFRLVGWFRVSGLGFRIDFRV